MHRREAEISAALPASAPAPRLLGTHDDGHWVALVLEDVDGRHPLTPWNPNELQQVIRALDELAEATTPAPLEGLATAADQVAAEFSGWVRVRADPPAGLDLWAVAHLDELCAAAERGLAALTGETLVHLDIRADNLLIREGGGQDQGTRTVTVVDWPWACRGPAWFDTVLLLINVQLYGGHDVPALLADLAQRSGADPDDLLAVVTGWAGYFTDIARVPPPLGLPTLRPFQRAQSEALLSLLARTGLPGPS
jgi:Ser/Thr protein kinase RdoA (MazF antagonist)